MGAGSGTAPAAVPSPSSRVGAGLTLVDVVGEVEKVGYALGPFADFEGGACGEVYADYFGATDLAEFCTGHEGR